MKDEQNKVSTLKALTSGKWDLEVSFKELDEKITELWNNYAKDENEKIESFSYIKKDKTTQITINSTIGSAYLIKFIEDRIVAIFETRPKQ